MTPAAAGSDILPDPEHIQAAVRLLVSLEPELVIPDASLSDLTTFRIGGPATGLCRIQTPEQARRFRTFAAERDLPCAFLGGGSNILAADEGFCGLLLKMEISTFSIRGENLVAGAGLVLDDAIRRSLNEGLTGLEFASGIPGTIGGAIVGNAGCYGHELSEFIIDATVLHPDGSIECLDASQLDFSYRSSLLSSGEDLLLQVTLRLCRGDTAGALIEREKHLADRREKHPVDLPCAGSFFRNLPPVGPGERRRAAGALLEQAGAMSMTIGGAAVFERHANIIVNRKQATCADVLALATAMRDQVRKTFGVELEAEVRSLPWRTRRGRPRPAV